VTLPLPFARQLLPVAESIGHQLPSNWYGLVGLFVIVVSPIAYGVWKTLRTGVKLSEVQTSVNTANESLNSAKQTLDGVSGQVTNGGTNLAITVGDIKRQVYEMGRQVGIVVESQRKLHDEHVITNRNIATLGEGMQDVREDVAALERKIEERPGQ
jgi:hypothetical protein